MFRIRIVLSASQDYLGGRWFTSDEFNLKGSAERVFAELKPLAARIILEKWDGKPYGEHKNWETVSDSFDE